LTHQLLHVTPDDADSCPVAFDVHVEVPVQVRDVEQLLEIVRGDVAFVLETVHAVATLRTVSLGLVGLA
jgi:hypothetical protein